MLTHTRTDAHIPVELGDMVRGGQLHSPLICFLRT